ncbi:nucleoside-diphosphate-sugar epimerase [Pseudomonas brassicacearum]|uniref:Nucleoside-diphosphate-sugar epimerase n=1 Tax=Pseudomonas brassicacearum TaxID=930166 RepID=A0AAW8M3J9_9PSED|nr:NAD(P)-dependent oxidoreductase [Pseudomonas brassicacearum]MDR6956353.1 nucleoside-diphosphate-sugar epimerase [Pseudomonas brassicacearum]
MNVLITGGTGFIGRALCKALLARGDKVYVLTRKKDYALAGVELIVGDILSVELPSNLSEIELIINCMGEIHDESKMFKLHVDGTRRLANFFAGWSRVLNKHYHFIQLSSVGAYGLVTAYGKKKLMVDERWEVCPVNRYELSKSMADEVVITTCFNEPRMTFTILRPTNVIGMEMNNQSFFQLARIVRKRMFFYIGTRETIANYIHVDDVVRAIELCSSSTIAKNKTYIVSNDCLLCDVIDAIASYYEVKSPRLIIPEFFIRLFLKVCPASIRLPLTSSRVDALVSQVSFSSCLINSELDFRCGSDIPASALSILKNTPK